MAHLADQVVPRLRLPAAWRQPRAISPVDAEHHHRLSGERVLAWSELDLSRLGPSPRRCCTSPIRSSWPDSQRLAAETPGGDSPFLRSVVASDRADVLVDVSRLGLLSRGLGWRRLIILQKIAVDVTTTSPVLTYKQRGCLDRAAVRDRMDPARIRKPASPRSASAPRAMERVLCSCRHDLHVRADELHAVHLFPVLNVTHAP